MASLLFSDIKRFNPKRALDAGAGKLRNFRFFPPHSYTAVGLTMKSLEEGRESQRQLAAKRGEPTLIEANLDLDFSFLGTFDLVVCTGTAILLENASDTFVRLAHHITSGGNLILDMPINLFSSLEESGIDKLFQRVEAIPFDGLDIPEALDDFLESAGVLSGVGDDLGDFGSNLSDDQIRFLTDLTGDEMKTSSTVEGSRQIYVRGIGAQV